MHGPVETFGVVGLFFVLTLQKRDLKTLTGLINRTSSILVSSENDVKLMNYSLCKRTLSGYAIHHELNGGLMVTQQIYQSGRFDVRVCTGNQFLHKIVCN